MLHQKLTETETFPSMTVIPLNWSFLVTFGILEYSHLPLGQDDRNQSKPITKLFRVEHIGITKRA